MKKESRATGIDMIGNVPWGTHICQLYRTKEDLTEILVPYFVSGLEHNEFCLWITSEPLVSEEATASLRKTVGNLDDYIAKGQIEILRYDEWYSSTEEFSAGNQFIRLLEKEDWAIRREFDGFRVNGNAFGLEHNHWKEFMEYEEVVSLGINRHRTIAICSYSLDQCGAPELLDLATSHELTLIRRSHIWEVIENTRYKRVLNLRRSGLNYADIARQLGMSRERVRQIVTGGNTKRRRPSPNNDSNLLTTSEAAKLLNVHINTIRRWSDNGAIQAYHVGQRGDRRFRRQDLDNFLRERAPNQ